MSHSLTKAVGMLLVSAAVADPALATGQSQASAAAAAPQGITKPTQDVTMQPAYVKAVAQAAYVWAWPMVNMLNRHDAITKAPTPGRLNGVLPAAPQGQISMLNDYIDPGQTFIACPNQDVAYGLGYFNLDEQPVVAQVPDFGGRFWVYALYDARTDQFGQIGAPYRTPPGFYLLVGPNWKGTAPKGITKVLHSPTALAAGIPRVFMDDTPEDRKAIQPVLNQIVFYPLSQFDGKMKHADWSKYPSFKTPTGAGGGETKWVIPEKFFDQLQTVLDTVPPQPGEEAMYAQFNALLQAARKNPEIKKQLTDIAIQSEKDIVQPFFQWQHNGGPAGNGWNRSQNNAEYGYDYFNRTATSKSNMFENRPNETQYFYTDDDSSGKSLDGSATYAVTFPKDEQPPVDGFWSLTLYNKEHFFFPNPLHRFSLGTKNKQLQLNADGSLTLYVGSRSPGKDKESNWLPAPAEHFSLYIRAYWGKQGTVDGSWKPPMVHKVS